MTIDGSQLLKGTLDVALLALLGAGPDYGQGLYNSLVELGLPGVADASVYGALRRLHLEGFLNTELVASVEGPARKYYQLNGAGQRARRDSIRAWNDLAAAMGRITKDEI
jgi:PadR family transcriptional regulator, regulatory protein PadR